MAEKTRSNPKTTAAVSQIVGNAGARYAAGQARIGAERLAAHEKAISQINRLRKGAVAAHNNAVAWQNQRLNVIRTRGNERVQRVLSGAERRLEQAQLGATRAAKSRTSELEAMVQRRVSSARVAGEQARTAGMNASQGVFRNPAGLPSSPSLNPVRAAELASNNAGIAQGRALNDLRRIRLQAPAREAAEIKKTVDAVARGIEGRANGIVRSTRAAEQNVIRHARNAAADIQSRFGSAAARAMEKAGPKASFLQRTLARAASFGQPLANSASEAAAKSLTTLGGTFASKAEIASRLATGGKTGKALQVAGKTAAGITKILAKTAAFPVTGPTKAIAGLFNSVEKAGSIVAGSGVGGKAIRAVTKAGGLAGGFAMGSWIDAGLNYAQFKAEGHSLSDLGKTTGSMTVDGHRVEFKNPSLGDVVLSRKYWGEALRGGVRQLSMGILGNNEWGWEAGGDPDPEEFNRRLQMGLDPNTGKALVSTDGTDVSGIIARQNIAVNAAVARNKAVTSYFMSFDPSQKGKVDAAAAANGARLLGLASPSSMDAAGFTSAIRSIGADRDAKIEALKQNPEAVGGKAIDDMMKRGRLTREEATAKYVDIVTRNITKQHDDRLALMMKSDLATKASDLNRKNAYLALTGRDYDVDTSAKLDDDAKQRYAEFNETWAGMSGYDRATFDADAFRKSLSSDADEAYKAMTAEPKED